MDAIRIFVGTEPKTEIAFRVLEFSIRRRTARPVEVVPMIDHPHWEYPTAGIKVGTGFSLRRWLIPSWCEWQGRAIYLDADQLVLADIGELWDAPETWPAPEGTSTWCTFQPDKFRGQPWPQSSVMVIDCAAARAQWGWDRERMLDWLRRNPSRDAYVDFMHAGWMKPRPRRIPSEWNDLNQQTLQTRLIHYTSEPNQPHYKPDHPLAGVWRAELVAAIKAGAIPRETFTGALAKWNVREDWRKTNGLHPYYKKYLPLFS